MLKSPIFKFFASLKLAVISILSLATVLATATMLESNYGMRASHLMIYGTWWFGGVLLMLGTNVFCAAMSRFPWKRHQTGFAVTHLGILTLLAGSFITQQYGVDGSLPVEEGKRNSDVLLTDMAISVTTEDGTLLKEIPFPETGLKAEGKLLEIELGPRDKIIVDQFLPRVVSEKSITPSPVPGLGAPAIKVNLISSRFDVSEWLIQTTPEKPAEFNLGPAVLSLAKLWTPDEAKRFLAETPSKSEKKGSPGYLNITYGDRTYRLPIEKALKRWTQLPSASLEIKIERYLPYAVVENNDLVSRSEEPVNPAVQLLARNQAGVTEKHTLFANFPDFNTLHRQKTSTAIPLGIKFRMIAAPVKANEQLAIVGRNRGRLEFASSGPKLYYRSFGKEGGLKGSGEVKPGVEIPTGWMDSKFNVTEWYPAAIQQEKPRYIHFIGQGESNYLSGLHYRRETDRHPATSDSGEWLVEGDVSSIPMGSENWVLHLTKQRLRLPFSIQLQKFILGTDPGTTKAASYQSDVSVVDEHGQPQKTAHISMNEPTTYGGYTFYQASYQMEEGKPAVSVFSVNYDPGRAIKYVGCLLMVLGILLMFYMNPHYWDKILGRRRA